MRRACGRRTLATCLRASSLAFHMLNDRLLDRYLHLGTRIRPHTLSQCREHTTSKRAERLWRYAETRICFWELESARNRARAGFCKSAAGECLSALLDTAPPETISLALYTATISSARSCWRDSKSQPFLLTSGDEVFGVSLSCFLVRVCKLLFVATSIFHQFQTRM